MNRTDPSAPALFLSPDHPLSKLERPALLVGAAGLLLCGLGWGTDPTQFFHSYLFAYVFWSGIALGCFAILMLQHVTGGEWGAVIRRLLESATGTLPLVALLFVPLVFGLGRLYEWARPEAVAHEGIRQFKSTYLNVPFFLGRTVVYFAVWLTVARLLNNWSIDQDRSPDPAPGRRMELLSRGGLVLYGLTVTFAAVDWAMSLEPHWFSTIYGVMFMGGQAVSAFAFIIAVAAVLADRGPLGEVISAKQFHDLGNLLLTFVMLWAYFAFAQYLIIWSGNLKEEISWYLHRQQGGWSALALAVILFHFCVPFVLLLSRGVKRSVRVLMTVALGLLAIHGIDVFWLITPAFSNSVSIHWLDVAAAVGLGGVWIGAFIWQLKKRPLLPLHDPSLPEA